MQINTGNKHSRIGIMGGTFDPIHNGHLVAASEVQSVYDLDEVIFVPANIQPFKSDIDIAHPEHRYLMTIIATAGNPKFSVSRVDIERGGITYTIDTLCDLRKLYPYAEFFFITGMDALRSFSKWKECEKLLKLATFIGVTRPEHDLGVDIPKDITILEVPAMAISSTDCRKRISENKPIWYLVPDGVVRYIGKYDLYKKKIRTIMFETEIENQVLTIVKAALEKQAEEIIAIDVSSRLALTDAFIITSADTQRQVLAIVDSIDEQMHKIGVVANRKEGLDQCHWVLLDYGAVVVHVQLTEDRQYYDLERLWSDCPQFEIPKSIYGEITGD